MKSKAKTSQTELKNLEKEMEKRVASASQESENLKSKLAQATKKATAANKEAEVAKAALAKAQNDAASMTAKLAAQAAALIKLRSETSGNGDTEMDSQPQPGASGIAATPVQSPDSKSDAAPEIEIDSADDQADAERKKRDAAKAEVKRKLAEREATLEAQKAVKKAEKDAAAEMKTVQGEGSERSDGNDEAEGTIAGNNTPAVMGLEDQIQILKDKRDELIAEAESKIREKQQSAIDEMIADGKAVDSEEVTSAQEELKNAIQSSSDKLTARYRRKIEKLKKAFKAKKGRAKRSKK